MLGPDLPSPAKESIGRLALHRAVVRETLRLHAPIHSIMRAAKSHSTFATKGPGKGEERLYSIRPSRVLISAPGVTAQSSEFFPNPDKWNPHRWVGMVDFMDATEKTSELGHGPVSKSAGSYYLSLEPGDTAALGSNPPSFTWAQSQLLWSRHSGFATWLARDEFWRQSMSRYSPGQRYQLSLNGRGDVTSGFR